jgi:putative ABC transport system substrate-binding protein
VIGRRYVIKTLALGLLSPLTAAAQAPTRAPRIGYLGLGSGGPSKNLDAFRQGLRELGYVEGDTILVEYRWAGGRVDRLPVLARDLVARDVRVIVAVGTRPIEAAMSATTTIPIVVAFTSDLLTAGKLGSLARPTGNVTGLTAIAPELSGKRLELLKEAVPKVTRVAVLWGFESSRAIKWGPTQAAAETLGLKLQSVEMRGGDDLPRAFSAMREPRANAMLVFFDGTIAAQRQAIVNFASRNGLPAMYEFGDFVHAGGLMAYGPEMPAMYHRAATYVDISKHAGRVNDESILVDEIAA